MKTACSFIFASALTLVFVVKAATSIGTGAYAAQHTTAATKPLVSIKSSSRL